MWQFRPCKAVWSTQKQLLRKARLMCWNDSGFFLSMVMWAMPGPSKMAFIGSCNLRQRSLEQFEEAQLDALNARDPMFTKQWYDMDILRHLQLNGWGRNQYQCTKQKLAFHFCAKELHARVTDTPFCAALWEELGRPNKSLGILNGWFRWLMVWSHTVTWDFVMCQHFFGCSLLLQDPGTSNVSQHLSIFNTGYDIWRLRISNGPIRLLQEADEVKHPTRCESWRNTKDVVSSLVQRTSRWLETCSRILYCRSNLLEHVFLCLDQYSISSCKQVPFKCPCAEAFLHSGHGLFTGLLRIRWRQYNSWVQHEGKKLGLCSSQRYTWWTSRSEVTAFSLKSAYSCQWWNRSGYLF